MNSAFELFNGLHQMDEPFLLGNVWNVQSAKVLEKLNFKAIGTSSAAVAETLGYKDGENMPFEEYLYIIRRIKASTTIPLSVDLEGGYGKTDEEVYKNVKRLHALGVVGINLEDSVFRNSVRAIVSAEAFERKLVGLTNQLKTEGIEVFINVRCDAFLLNLPEARKDAIRRIRAYMTTGIHGIFLPCITDVEDIKATVAATTLPVNVMCMPGLPDFDKLKLLGVKRISMGNFINHSLYGMMESVCRNILSEGSFSAAFRRPE